MQLSVLLIGRHDRAEFCDAVDWLHQRTDLQQFLTVEAAASWLARCEHPPEVIVLAQSRAGQYAQRQIEMLWKWAPLARIVALLGSWCEGELRTGHPLPGVIRIYWHQWMSRFPHQWERILTGDCPVWGLPLTSSDDESVDYLSSDPVQRRQGLIAIDASCGETADMLGEMLHAAGYATVWLDPRHETQVRGTCAAIWDGPCCDSVHASRIERLARLMDPAPIIALMDFPRHHDCVRAAAAGAARVVSKPFLMDDVLWQLDDVLRQQHQDYVAAPVA